MEVTNGGNEGEQPRQDDPARAQADSTRAGIDSTRAGTDSTRALVDSGQAGTDSKQAVTDSAQAGADSTRAQEDSDRAQIDSDRKDRRSLYRILAYLFMGVCVAIAVWRVETTADEAHDVAVDFRAAEEREDKEEAQERVQNCAVRNTAIRNGRERFVQFSENVAGLVAQSDDPARSQRILTALFKDINLDANSEDLDCTGDGEITDADYSL